METVKVVTRGRSQLIRIPQEYRLNKGDDYSINKIGAALIIVPKDQLKEVYEEAASDFTSDFMADGRPEEMQTGRLELFG